MLPRAEDHLRLRIPDPDLYGNRHVPSRADHNNPRHYFGAISNIVVRPVLGSLAT